MSNRNYDELRIQVNKTTPENVKEAHEALFHATMNLPAAAAHCGMTQKQLKLTFWEYLKYHAPNFEIPEDSSSLSRWEESCPE